MTFESFTSFITALEKYFEKESHLAKTLSEFSDSPAEISFCPIITNTIFAYLKKDFNDDSDIITWWFWEREFDKNLTAYDGFKNEVVINTHLEFYNYLITNIKKPSTSEEHF